MQEHIPDALIAAFECQYGVHWNHAGMRNERLAMRYGWAAAMEAKQCLHQIQEPAVNQQLTTEQEPVWGQSRFHGQPWMSCAAEHVTMVLADQRYAAEGYEARYLYAAPVLAAQPAKSLMKRVDAAAEAMSEVMAHVNLGAWSVKFERALAGLRAVQETEPQAAPAAIDGGHHVDG